MIAWIRIGLIALGLGLLTIVAGPLQVLAIARRWPIARRLPLLWHRVACRLTGLKVECRGAPAEGRPLLIVANHQSWADILVLGSVMELSFIAKAEVGGWPVFGWLARLQRTVFVERERRGRSGEQADAIAERLTDGDAMVLFPEGTTSDGNAVLPFKTALFGAAQAALKRSGASEVLVQPVAVAYLRANGVPLGRYGRVLAAWPGEVELAPHLLAFLKEGAVDAEVVFGAPIRFTRASERKALARQSEAAVKRLLADSLSGRIGDDFETADDRDPVFDRTPAGATRETALASGAAGSDIGETRDRP